MTPDSLTEVAIGLGREAIWMSLLISAPVLLAGMVVGLVIGLLQAVTQIQEQTVAFVPKIVIMVLVLELHAALAAGPDDAVHERADRGDPGEVLTNDELAGPAERREVPDLHPGVDADQRRADRLADFRRDAGPGDGPRLIALALAVLIMPSQWFATLPYPGSLLVYVVVLGGELVIGLVLGLGITILLGGIQMAGDLMSRVGGLTLSDVFDPMTSTNVPLFSQLLSLLSTARVPDHRRPSHAAGRPAGHVPRHPARRKRGDAARARRAAVRAPGCSRRWSR